MKYLFILFVLNGCKVVCDEAKWVDQGTGQKLVWNRTECSLEQGTRFGEGK